MTREEQQSRKFQLVPFQHHFRSNKSNFISSFRLGTVAVSGKSNWELLDSLIQRLFKEYLMRIDPICSLGLSAESIEYYQVIFHFLNIFQNNFIEEFM